ncbi:MAG: hypothetical protein AYP45_13155 [Candidatus Brocadia carolinensis]|uniref:Uncharacterized protein n=1 Tax=Candidatus Brocadia carolinensis TaxID=1004156 RepID=A0A1V4ARJ7_9BACT|nr:MAG: hypothetical protein AYP45_13155 [Candidatus Brocadia caroliniensis]
MNGEEGICAECRMDTPTNAAIVNLFAAFMALNGPPEYTPLTPASGGQLFVPSVRGIKGIGVNRTYAKSVAETVLLHSEQVVSG